MEYWVLLGLLLIILVLNTFYIAMFVSFSRFITKQKADSPKKAVSLKNKPLYKAFLIGPMAPWSPIIRTTEGKYWYKNTHWKGARLSALIGFTVVTFFNITLIIVVMLYLIGV